LNRIEQIPDAALWQAHLAAKRTLIERVRSATGLTLSAELPILAFARRMTAYKRPDLLFFDIERLQRIARAFPFQLVIAGKAHPHDQAGKQLIEALNRYRVQLSGSIPIAFLPNYNMQIALEMVSGADIWLNTPLPPLEASGTSGMKAAFNGVPSLSVLDGWWMEGCIEGITGWSIGNSLPSSAADDASSLYDKLERSVLPLYRSGLQAWAPVMRGAIGKNAAYFNSHRMMRRYATEAYIR
jgi:starch phosphorylase